MKRAALAIALCILPVAGQAYGVSAHEQLTKNTFAEYAHVRDPYQFSDDDVAAAMEGSSEEDEMRSDYGVWYPAHRRPVNHFYDPIYNRGLTVGANVGVPSPLWAIDTKQQAGFGNYWSLGADDTLFSGGGDYSWNRAVYEYTWGDKKRGMETLGHILHLLQDAASPAHTRNDPHLGAWARDSEPYEDFTKDLKPHVILTMREVPYVSAPDKGIQELALYTNTHFFSRDSLDDYPAPDKNKFSRKVFSGQLYGLYDGNYVAIVDDVFDEETIRKKRVVTYPDADQLILSSNWNALSEKSVAYGVGMIDLFLRNVALERQTHALRDANISETHLALLNDTKDLAQGGYALAKSLYGSSMSLADMADLNRDDWKQSAAVAAVYDSITHPHITPVDQPPPPAPAQEEESLVATVARIKMQLADAPANEQPAEAPSQPQGQQLPPAPSAPVQSQPAPAATTPIVSPLVPGSGSWGGGYGGSGSPSGPSDSPPEKPAPPTLTTTVSPCLHISTDEQGDKICTATPGPVTVSWVADDGATFALDTAPTADASHTWELGAENTESHTVAATTAGGTITHAVTIKTVTRPVIISEVGYNQYSDESHEYVELYNQSDVPVSLDGLVLQASSLNLPLTGTIAPHAYFLATNGFEFPELASDMTTPWIGSISHGTDTVQLGTPGDGELTRIIDSFPVGCPPLSDTCHVNHPFAIERSLRAGLQTGYTYPENTDRFARYVPSLEASWYGTPKARNSVDYVILTMSGTYPTTYSPYYVPRDVTVPVETHATFEPGVEVQLKNNVAVTVNGWLTFGASGGSVVQVNPVNSNSVWRGFFVSPTGSLTATNTTFTNGGRFGTSAIENQGGAVTLAGVTITGSETGALGNASGATIATDLTVSNSSSTSYGVRVQSGTISIERAAIDTAQDFGLLITPSVGPITACTLKTMTITNAHLNYNADMPDYCSLTDVNGVTSTPT